MLTGPITDELSEATDSLHLSELTEQYSDIIHPLKGLNVACSETVDLIDGLMEVIYGPR